MKADADTKARLLFALCLALLAAAGAIWYFTAALRQTTFALETHDPVSGLIKDAPVEFRGVLVGKVRKVELADPSTVRVLLDVDKDTPISTATVATITSRGLATHGFTGYVYIALDDDGSERKALDAADGQGHPVIRTVASKSVNLDLAIAQVNGNVEALTQKVDALLDPRTIAALQQSADSLQHVSKSLETQVIPNAQKTLTRLDELSASATAVTDKLKRDPSVALRGTGRRAPGPGEQ